MKYGFTYEITTNCNYYCDYCDIANKEEYSSINTVNNVIKFLTYIYNNMSDNDTMRIQIMGGEPTVHPHFEYFVNEIYKLKNIKLIIITNFSADVELYDRLCNNNTLKDLTWYLSYHENHISLEEYMHKFDYLINKYPNIKFSPQCMLANDRKTTEEIINIFSKYNNYTNFMLSIFPIITTRVNYNNTSNINLLDEEVVNKSDLNMTTDKNTRNSDQDKNINCLIENSYIKSNGHLSLCFSYKDKTLLDLNSENVIKKFDIIRRMNLKCYKITCYFKANWKCSNKDENNL